MDPQKILAIERPHPNLMKLYFIHGCLLPPLSFVALLPLYFRYHTMRYHFDDEGVTMRWGILFRREISLSYARIQDIHLTSGIFQRWLGLADVHIQTASGSAAAEMKIEGLKEFADVRDFLYGKMRGARKTPTPAATAAAAPAATPHADELVATLREVTAELRAARLALERAQGGAAQRGGAADV
jgi:putative membrane protein